MLTNFRILLANGLLSFEQSHDFDDDFLLLDSHSILELFSFESQSFNNTSSVGYYDGNNHFDITNTSVDILFDGDIPLEVRIPLHMNLSVVKTEQGEKGNTATGATKPAELETGLIVQVPLFIKEGDKLRIDTKDKKYIERVKE